MALGSFEFATPDYKSYNFRLPVKKANPARMASLFFSVSKLCGVIANQIIKPSETSTDSSPP